VNHAASAQPAAREGPRAAVEEHERVGVIQRAKRWMRLLGILAVNALVLAMWCGLMAWFAGRMLTDRLAWSQWLWWMPTPAALLVATLGVLLAFRRARTAARRRRRLALWGACWLVLATWFSIFEHRLLRREPAAPANALTLMHWNMTLDNNADVPRLLDTVARLDADITVLTTPPGDVRILLTRQADASEGTEDVFFPWPMFLHSRLPIIRGRILIATDGVSIAEVEIDATSRLGRAVTLWVVDLPSNPRRPRMDIARRARRLLDELEIAPPDLIAGDFNITRNSASIEILFPGMIDAYNGGGHGYGASFARQLPLYHIDHVLVNPQSGIAASRYDLIDAGQSRHRAQKAWITAAK
jgi:endonuclease/exonuclease/phosphatase family metal-dependent hydrolase